MSIGKGEGQVLFFAVLKKEVREMNNFNFRHP